MSLSADAALRGLAKQPARRRRSRGTGQRTRTGCYTCKYRRVKCDETKPACRRCTDFGRTCEGYPDTSNLGPLPAASRSSSPGMSRAATAARTSASESGSRRSSISIHSFNDHIQYTMPNMPGYFAPDFWSELVERVAASEPAVQYALRALAAAHSATIEGQGSGSPITPTMNPDSPSSQAALHHYNAAIAQLARIMATRGTRGTETILVCCFLFVCIEALFKNFESAIKHAEAGLRVYKDWLGNASPFLDTTTSTVSATNPRYCIWRLAAELESCLGDLANQSSIQDEIIDDGIWTFDPTTEYFATQEHVSCALVSMRRKIRRLSCTINGLRANARQASEEALQQHAELVALWRAFEEPYHQFMASIEPNHVDRGILLLQLKYLTQTIIHDSMLSPLNEADSQQRFTDVLDTVVMILRPIPLLQYSPTSAPRTSSSLSIMTLNEHIPTLSLVGEIIPPLFHTAKTAPSIAIRQRAIGLLHACNAIEGIWNSKSSAKRAEDMLRADFDGSSFMIL